MTKVYCPYSDREIPMHKTSREHVIPLALGGANGFEVRVDTDANSKLGASLDGKLASELIFALKRTQYDARGHSGKKPEAVIKKASYGKDDRLAQVQMHRNEGMRVWDVKDRETRKAVGKFRIETTISVDLPVRFTAKVALAAGFLVYKDLFRECVDHRQLRDVMNLDMAALKSEHGKGVSDLKHLTLRADDYMHDPLSDDLMIVLRAWCSGVGGSTVVLMPGDGCFGVAVGVLGQYLGMVNVPADTKHFPNQGDYHWGHVVSIVAGKITRKSWLDCLKEWLAQGVEK